MDRDYKIIRRDEGTVVEPSGEKIREIFSNEKTGIGVAEAKIKDANLHRHEKTHELYFVLEGGGRIEVGNDTVRLQEGDLIYVSPGTPHRAYAENRPFKCLVISNPPWKEEDHHVLEG